MNLYIVRHGNPDYVTDTLTELGHRQAEACAEDMLELNIDEIYSSPYGRAQETAAHLADKLNKPVEILPWAHEVEHYSDNGRGGVTMGIMMDPTLLRSPEMLELGDNWAGHPAFRDEASARFMVDEVYDGMREFLARFGYIEDGQRFRVADDADEDKNVALYCHAGVFLIMADYLLRLPTMTGWTSFFTWQTGITWVHLNNSGGFAVPRFYTMGKTDHLSKRGIPIT